MDQGELAGFLEKVEWVALGTLEGAGVIHPDVAPVHVADGMIYFTLPAESRSARNLGRDARVCCAADVFPSYYEIRGATVHGTAEPLEAARTPDAVIKAIAANAARHELRAGEVCYRLPITADSFGFDFSKIKTRR